MDGLGYGCMGGWRVCVCKRGGACVCVCGCVCVRESALSRAARIRVRDECLGSRTEPSYYYYCNLGRTGRECGGRGGRRIKAVSDGKPQKKKKMVGRGFGRQSNKGRLMMMMMMENMAMTKPDDAKLGLSTVATKRKEKKRKREGRKGEQREREPLFFSFFYFFPPVGESRRKPEREKKGKKKGKRKRKWIEGCSRRKSQSQRRKGKKKGKGKGWGRLGRVFSFSHTDSNT